MRPKPIGVDRRHAVDTPPDSCLSGCELLMVDWVGKERMLHTHADGMGRNSFTDEAGAW